MNSMKKLVTIVIFALLIIPLQGVAEDVDTSFQAGNAAYSVGDYDKAISIYDDLLKTNGLSAGLLYNLGNSYAQKGQVGLAILNYERALRLDPSNLDISGNLAKVRKESGLFLEEPGTVERFLTLLSVDGWAVVAVVSLGFMAFLLFLRLQYKPSFRYYAGSWFAAFLLVVVSVAGVTYGFKEYNPLVVVATDAKLQISPFAGASSVGAVEPGRLLYPIKNHGEYIYATDKVGRKGWLRREAVASVCDS